jgi:hypothetical protein
MTKSFSVGRCFLWATILQVFLLSFGMASGGGSFLAILYSPVSLLTEMFIHAKSEADAAAGIFFLPPVVLFYSLAVTFIVATARKRQAQKSIVPNHRYRPDHITT